MLKTFVKKGSYHDSVALMLLTNCIQAIDGVQKASIMMGTPANKDIFMQSGLQTPELMQASANDMVIVAELRDEALMDVILKKTDEFSSRRAGRRPPRRNIRRRPTGKRRWSCCRRRIWRSSPSRAPMPQLRPTARWTTI